MVNKAIKIFFILLLYFYVASIHFKFKYLHEDYPVDEIAISILKTVLVLVFFAAGTVHLYEWERLQKFKLLLLVQKVAIVPFVSLFCMLGYNISLIANEFTLLLLACSLYLYYLFNCKSLIEETRNIVGHGKADHMFYSRYPPLNRGDMLGIDVGYAVLATFPLFMKSVLIAK